jgi:hypothetical protein
MLIVENSILEKARGLFNPKFVNDAQNVIEKSQVKSLSRKAIVKDFSLSLVSFFQTLSMKLD